MSRSLIGVAGLMVILSAAPLAAAQTPVAVPAEPARPAARLNLNGVVPVSPPLRGFATPRPPQQTPSPASPPRRRSAKRIVAGAAIGAAAGFFGGGYIGARIEGTSCDCDDPGLQGFLIGAPMGAALGGVLGGKYLF